MQERLQKIIARAGVSSRRAAEELITSGRVRVNGRVVTELGAKADPRADKVEVDGKRITAPAPIYVALHKPRNVVSTLSDPEGRPSVAELLATVGTRIFPVGRLDFATSGVLLATNDGEFSQGLLHPKKGVPKTYVVKVSGQMDPTDVERWAMGVDLEDGRTRPADVHFLRHEEDKSWFEITIYEGRNQQIRRMGEATGFPVMRLARVSFAGISHEGLRPGQWRHLTPDELQDLRKEYGVPKRVRSAEAAGRSGEIHGKIQQRGELRRARGPRPEQSEAPASRARRPFPRDEAPRAPRGDRPETSDAPAPRARRPYPQDQGPRAPRAPRPETSDAPAPRARRPFPQDKGPRAPRGDRPTSGGPAPRGPRPAPGKRRG